jgi:hypothetical protein
LLEAVVKLKEAADAEPLEEGDLRVAVKVEDVG